MTRPFLFEPRGSMIALFMLCSTLSSGCVPAHSPAAPKAALTSSRPKPADVIDLSNLNLHGPYMGQKPPGLTAEVFAPGIISTDAWELEGVFAPGMREFYFVTDRGAYTKPMVIGFRFEDNKWRKFTEFRRTGEPSISADGSIMYLAKGYRERTPKGWSKVKSLGPLLQRDDWGIMRLTASSRGTYVSR